MTQLSEHTFFKSSIDLGVVRDTVVTPFMIIIVKDGVSISHEIRERHFLIRVGGYEVKEKEEKK
jgi:hypothetical protein